MSLRGFHLLFISIASIFCAIVAVWSLYYNATTTDTAMKILGWGCAVVAVILPLYGVSFYRKNFNQQEQ